MRRPWTYTLAVVLNVLYCLIGLSDTIPALALGAAASQTQYGGDGPPFFLTLISFAVAIIGLVSSYGVWKMQKWGSVMTIIVQVVAILTSLPALIFAPPPLNLIGGVGVLWSIVVIALLLWPKPKGAGVMNHVS